MSLSAPLRPSLNANLAEPAQGWRGGLQLALHVLVTGVIVSVLLSLAVVGMAAQAASPPLATAATTSGDAFVPVLFAGGVLALAASARLLRSAAPTALQPTPSAEEALEQRARFAGWVC